MKTYEVTVERLMVNDKPYHTDTLHIMAERPEEAQAIVHNNFELSLVPKFRITKVVEHGNTGE